MSFRDSDRHEIDKAIRAAEQASRFEFSVFVGRAEGTPRGFAERLHGASVAPDRSVLVMVDPRARVIEVVTGDARTPHARPTRRSSSPCCRCARRSPRATWSEG